MSAVAAVSEKQVTTEKAEREGVVAILQDQPTLERVQGIIRELHLEDELSLEPTLDSALRRIREGDKPRVLILDLSDSDAPIAELSAARAIGGSDLKIVALGVVNDVALFRDLLAAGATDYVVKPVSREALASALEKRSPMSAQGGLGQVVAFMGSRGGVGTTMTAVSCAWILSENRREPTALLDLDLHFGTVALKLRPALRVASQVLVDRGGSAAHRDADPTCRARRGEPRCRAVRAQPRRTARYDPPADLVA